MREQFKVDLFFWPLVPTEKLTRTSHLTLEELGALMRLQMKYWDERGLPNDDARLARSLGITIEKFVGEIKEAMQGFFDPEWRCPELDIELAKAESLAISRQEAGRKSGEARRAKKEAAAAFKPGSNSVEAPLERGSNKDEAAFKPRSNKTEAPFEHRSNTYNYSDNSKRAQDKEHTHTREEELVPKFSNLREAGTWLCDRDHKLFPDGPEYDRLCKLARTPGMTIAQMDRELTAVTGNDRF